MPTDNIAAIDLGSNSFHMIIVRTDSGQLQLVDRMKEMVQLATGLDQQQMLTAEAQQRALACLARFGQRLRHVPTQQVRAVGTNTLRQARNSRQFLDQAETALGHPIEIISGIEEARLIYLGVVHSTATVTGRRLVIDIGGGSTELITGEGIEPLQLESLYMGCISMTQRFFSDNRIRESKQKAAELAVRRELEPVAMAYRKLGWRTATGASGTIKAVRDIIHQEGWSRDGITQESMQRLRALLGKLGNPTAFAERWQLSAERASVISGGFTVLNGIFQALNIEQLQVAEGALREGVVHDLLGRIHHAGAREQTIALLSKRYGIDIDQAQRVSDTAIALLDQVNQSWELTDERFFYDLKWAASLHELGLAIAHSHHHKHGAYILQYSDLPGFSHSEQVLLAALVRGHRRKFPLDVFQQLPEKLIIPAERLSVLLRLAVMLHRSHRRHTLPVIKITAQNNTIVLCFPKQWLKKHPLTNADLQEEVQYLKNAGFGLEFS